jgi:hydrophobe/amphiphile efflux-3 (HAE3) family protein
MILERIGEGVAKAPAVVMATILLLTLVLGFFASQTDMSSNEEDFNPDSDAANASGRINDYFGAGVRTVQVITRDPEGKNGDILNQEALLGILDLQECILEPKPGDPDITDTLESTDRVPTGVQSIADMIALGAMSLEGSQLFTEEMLNTTTMMDQMNTTITQLSYGILLMNLSDPESVGSNLTITEGALEQIVDMIEQMGGNGGAPSNGNGGMGFPNLTTIRMMIQGMDDSVIKGTITAMNTFDPTSMAVAVQGTVTAREATEATSDPSSGVVGAPLTDLMMDEDFMEGNYTFMGMPVDHATLMTDSLTHLLTIQIAVGMITGFENQPEVMTSIIFGLAGGLQFVLSTDYDPAEPLPRAKASLMIVQQNGSMDSERILESQYELEEIADDVEKEHGDSVEFGVMAGEILFDKINNSSMDSLSFLLGMAILFIIVILALVFRSLTDTGLTLGALLMVIVWTFGLGVILGFTFNPMTIAVPVLLVGLAVDYGIHLTMRYRLEKREHSLDRSITLTIASVGMALLLATVTTVFSFMSNILSDLQMMREFGMLAAMGIISAFVVMVTFVPAARLIIDRRRERKGKRRGSSSGGNNNGPRKQTALVRFVQVGATAGAKHGPIIAIVALLLSGLSFYSVSEIETEFNFMDFLPEELEESQTINYLLDNFNFSSSASSVLVESDDVGTATVLGAIYQTEDNMATARDVVKVGDRADTRSPVTVILRYSLPTSPSYLPEIGDVYDTTAPDANGIPTTNVDVLIDTLMAHPATKDDVQSVIHVNDDGDYDAAIIRVTVHDASDGGKKLNDQLNTAIGPLKDLKDDGELDEAIVTDGPVLTYLTVTAMNSAGLQSVVATVIMAMILLMVVYFAFYRTVAVGLVSTIPIILVIGWVFGSMFLLGIPLNVVTIMIAALTIGLGITYAIHISHRFLEDLETRPWKDALCNTVGHTGAALFGAAATTIGGFGILTFSVLPPMAQFGIVTALSIFYSFLASVFVLPSFLAIWAKWKFGDGDTAGKMCETVNEEDAELDAATSTTDAPEDTDEVEGSPAEDL